MFDFKSKVTGEPLTPSGVSLMSAELARAAGVKLTMKALRRGLGCRYAGKVPAQVLQKIMRHASIKTTTDFYTNVDEAAEEAILRPERNRKRNSDPAPTPDQAGSSGATPEVGTAFD